MLEQYKQYNIDEEEACKETYNFDKQTFQCLFMSTSYCFVMSSVCNTVVLVKSFETLFTCLKQRLDESVTAK